jgi:hypothetical protein
MWVPVAHLCIILLLFHLYAADFLAGINKDQVDAWWSQIHVTPHFLLRTCGAKRTLKAEIGNCEVFMLNFKQVDIIYCV